MKRSSPCRAMTWIIAIQVIYPVAAQIDTFSVRDQPVDQVLLAFAEQTGVSIVTDTTVTGSVSLVLHDASPERAVREIAGAADLFVEDRHDVWYLSRVRLRETASGVWRLESRGGTLAAIIARIARSGDIFVTVPRNSDRVVEIAVEGDSAESLLRRLATALELELRERDGFFHLEDSTEAAPSSASHPRGTIMIEGTYATGVELTALAAPRVAILQKIADHLDHSLVISGDLLSVVPAVELTVAEREELPRRVAAALDLRIYLQDDTLFAVDSFDTGGLRRFYHTRFLPIEAVYRETLAAALTDVPDLMINGETDRGILVSGMEASLRHARERAEMIASSRDAVQFFHYHPKAAAASAIVEALSIEFHAIDLQVTSGTETILGWAPREIMADLEVAARRWDTADDRRRYRCRFVDPDEIVEFVSVHFAESRAAVTGDGTAITLAGSPATHLAVERYLRDVDRPRRQLRFDLCIIQYQSGRAVQHGVDLFAENTPDVAVHTTPLTGSGSFNGVLELQFDVISRLGYQAAVAISDELTSNRARLVLDTSLKALHRETARLENSSTFRYRDVLGEEDESSWRSVVREINSGLAVEVTGSLHDDRSITVDIRVELSRQGADVSRNGNPPPTSQRVVESTVRVHPGEPVVIGGLLQQEESRSEHRFPLLGRVPLLRKLINRHDRHSQETELVLYLSAFPAPLPSAEIRRNQQIHRLNELIRGGLR